ncbi:hypothetical protein SAY86_009167 [Trapa natans]|uniref:Uncharacterized protein n=1 Tax=Trapa natans TaxID=22666 RepID=A0AAN7QCC2_TRANT|nr:hypothetical protein SAY86_009167 [Trapa natans]
MDYGPDFDFGFQFASPLAFPNPIPPPAPRRLSSTFSGRNRPIASAGKRLTYVSLQGRLVGNEEATSARSVGGFGPVEAAAWQLFSPIQRVVLVAVIGVAVAESKRNRIISQLRNSVHLRDQIISDMQQKLDNLCGQVNTVKEQPGFGDKDSTSKNAGFTLDAGFEPGKINFVECGCWLCDEHQKLSSGTEVGFRCDAIARRSSGLCLQQGKPSLIIEQEPEERRLSDLSDWASSISSAADIQMSGLAVEQDGSNLKRESDEKDARIRELSEFLCSSEAAGSKRIAELEDAILRKNKVITKLKKDMYTLEQKVVQLARLGRPTYTRKEDGPASKSFPFMLDNILYDMDSSTTSQSGSSDCDSWQGSRPPQPSAVKFMADNILYGMDSTPSPPSSDSDSSPGSCKPSTAKFLESARRNPDMEKALKVFPTEQDDPPPPGKGSPFRKISSSQDSSVGLRQIKLETGDLKRSSRPKQTQSLPGRRRMTHHRKRWS